MSDIIREVDEELRRENWEKLWKRYGKFVFGAAVGLVAATAAVVGWRAYDKDQRLKQGNNFAAAVATAESSESLSASADAMAALAENAAAGYAMLAGFREAMLRAEAGEHEAAIAIYDALAEDDSVEPMFRDLAVLYSVRVQTDTGDAATLIARLAPLTAEDGDWRCSGGARGVPVAGRRSAGARGIAGAGGGNVARHGELRKFRTCNQVDFPPLPGSRSVSHC